MKRTDKRKLRSLIAVVVMACAVLAGVWSATAEYIPADIPPYNPNGFVVQAIEDFDICYGEPVVVSARHNCDDIVPGGTVTWSWSPPDGSGANTDTMTMSSLSAGEHTYTATAEVTAPTGGEGPASDDVKVTVVKLEDPTYVSSTPFPDAVMICGGTCTITVDITPSGRTVVWGNLKLYPDKTNEPMNVSCVAAGNDYIVEALNTPAVGGTGYLTVEAWDSALPNCKKLASVVVMNCSSCVFCAGGYYYVGCLESKIYFGRNSSGGHAGYLRLNADEPSLDLAKPEGLFLLNRGNEAIYENTNTIRQVLSAEGLADLVVSNDYMYGIHFYYPTDLESSKDTNGLYVAQAGKSPFASYIIENPAATNTDFNRLKITEIRSGGTKEREFIYSSGDWSLSEGGGIKIETLSEVINGQERTVTRTVSNNVGVVASKVVTTYHTFPWGERETMVVTDPDGAALTNCTYYYENAAETGRYGRIRMIVGEDGSCASGPWKKVDYSVDGLVTSEITPWLDADTNALASQARQVTSDYSPVDSNDNGQVLLSRPRVVTKEILGTVVSKTYYAYYTAGGNRVEITERCATNGAPYGDASNLRTISTYYPTSTSNVWSGKIRSMQQPDGRLATYVYQYGTYTTNSDPSLNTFTADGTGVWVRASVTNGTITSTNGIVNRTTVRRTIENELGREVAREDYAYTDSGLIRIDWTVNEYDQVGKLVVAHYADGTKTETVWGCCDKDEEIDRNGIEMTYSHDAAGRVDIVTKQGDTPLVTSYVLDPAGKRLSTTRSADGLSLVSSNLYDGAGRLTNSISEAGLITAQSYAEGGRVSTLTEPGGATRITTKYTDGRTKTVTGTAVTAMTYAYGINVDGTRWTKTYTGSDGTNSLVWTKATTDMLGRTISQERPGFGGTMLTSESFHNAIGQLVKTTSPGQAPMLYEYDSLGQQIRSGLDIGAGGTLVLASSDRISETESYYELDESNDCWQVTVSKVYPDDGSAVAVTNSISKTRLTGLSTNKTSEMVSIDIHGNETITTASVDRENKTMTQVADHPDSTSNSVSVTVNGLLASTTDNRGRETTYAYDALERRTGVTDPRTGTSITHYDANGLVDWTEDAANRTSYAYEVSTGRRIAVTNALGRVTRYSHDIKGQMVKTWGDAVYPVSYVFDEYGRMADMSTYRSGTGWSGTSWPTGSEGTADTTVWSYDEATGLLTNKLYADDKGVAYTYTSDSKLLTRTWSRGDTTTYSFDQDTGEMTNINYSDSTPDVAFTFDRMGRRKTVDDAIGTWSYIYNSSLQMETETLVASGFTPTTNVLTRTYDSLGRVADVDLNSVYSVNSVYSSLGRLSSISSSVFSASSVVNYSYLPNSDLIAGVSNSVNSVNSVKTYESNRNLLTQIQNTVDAITVSQYDYSNDAVGRRTVVKNSGTQFDAGEAFNLYGYNDRNELIGSGRYFGTDTGDTSDPVALQSFAYGYDNIGNRVLTTNSGNAASYTANQLNQYSQRTVPPEVSVIGTAHTNANVTVNDQAVARQNGYFYKVVTVTNDSGAVYQDTIAVGVRKNAGTGNVDVVTMETGSVFVAQTPESFTYDDDGNLLTDGRWTNTWNGENRLITMETLDSVTNSGVPKIKLVFAYDHQGRRMKKTVYSGYSVGTYSTTNVTTFLYDGWNMVKESSTGVSPVINYYTWGLDLSGSFQGAGGIGGLLGKISVVGNTTNGFVYAYDANGNVATIVETTDGTVVGQYEYDPFGNIIRATGDAADDNVFRFSTKYRDVETGWLYYGYRYYNPTLGRWPSRDPLGESGGENLFAFVKNRPTFQSDPSGLYGMTLTTPTVGKCGFYSMGISFSGLAGGLIVQEVTKTFQITKKGTKVGNKCCNVASGTPGARHFFEIISGNDTSNYGDQGDCSVGWLKTDKIAVKYSTEPPGFVVQDPDPTGAGGRSSYSPPPDWLYRLGVPSWVKTHGVHITWNCWEGSFRSNTTVSPYP